MSLTQFFRTLPSFSSVERICVAIVFLGWSNKHVTSKLLFIQVKIHELPTKKKSETNQLNIWLNHFGAFTFLFIISTLHTTLPSVRYKKLVLSKTGVPNLGYMYPQGYIFLSEGVHLRLAIEEKNIFTYCLLPNIYTYM